MASLATMVVALRSVGTVATLALGGVFAHRRGFLGPEVTKGLGRISMELTIPCLLFTTALSCSTNKKQPVACPPLADSLAPAWPLLFLPVLYVPLGLALGALAARVGNAPADFRRTAAASVAFGNSTGMPVTLIAAISAQGALKSTAVDPLLYLSVYLVLYPVLQWSVGARLLRPRQAKTLPSESAAAAAGLAVDERADESRAAVQDILPKRARSFAEEEDMWENAWRQLRAFAGSDLAAEERTTLTQTFNVAQLPSYRNAPTHELRLLPESYHAPSDSEASLLRSRQGHASGDSPATPELAPPPLQGAPPRFQGAPPPLEGGPPPLQGADVAKSGDVQGDRAAIQAEVHSRCAVVRTALPKMLPPPVIAALLGITVGLMQPVRGLLIDVIDMDNDAPLEWMFAGLRRIGEAAVPLNMLLLGASLSKQLSKDKPSVPLRPRLAVTVAKLVVFPAFGAVVGILLKTTLPFINPGALLVVMIVTCTPTANNLIVMAEVAGENQDALAATILMQYCVTPLSVTVWLSVFLAIVNS